MKRLDNKVAIVTGASKGIGAGIAKAFGAEGAAGVVNYARDHEAAERVVREITGKGGRAIALQRDAAQRSHAQSLVPGAKKAFSALGLTRNNARGGCHGNGVQDADNREYVVGPRRPSRGHRARGRISWLG